ncbi:Retrovirus-related Pol polyprotein from transposon TNT 1-94 [Eumeta japonica]|uniref:Retrovirus-related Pol polyprotein from transposon TNT 1-94 n=1 Tax=Eumeta variegata TaxID=151549 RepID=A0A4C1SRD4_EUMVA|nr:Retrovirus-related Pol polyprotein from transposon TNT 1-94 [Eumeta japonica]
MKISTTVASKVHISGQALQDGFKYVQFGEVSWKENFATWKFSMKTYLEHEDLWCCVECPKDKPVDASKDVKAKSKLILLLDPQNYVHVQECKTAKQVWDSLQRAFDDNGLTRNTEVAHLTSSTQSCDTYLWHLRMGHLNFHDVKKLPDVTEGVTLTQQQSNIACTLYGRRQARMPFKSVGSRAERPLELIHSDLCGPMENSSFGGMKYFITYIDDFTRMTSIPYTPQQNGMAERMNRTLVERARCMLFYANLEKKYWAEALATAAYVVNRSPTKSLQGKTPYEMWKGMKPNLSHMKIFGSEAMVHVPSVKRQKWDKKSVKMILVGYCENSKGYRFMDPRSHKVIKTRDVVFMENVLSNCETHVPATSSSVQPESTQSSSGKENHTPETSTSEPLLGSKDPDTQEAIVKAQVSMILTLEALASPQAADWKQAMNEEYASLMKNKTWSLTELPSGKGTSMICTRWGSDYEEIYSPVVKYTTIRYLFALAARYGLEIDQMDAVSAFLQERLTEIFTCNSQKSISKANRYLQGTKDLKLTYTKDGDENITGYCDADWASDVIASRALVTLSLQGGAISWRSHKQQTVALSTAEAEYMAMSGGAGSAVASTTAC